MLHVKLIEPPCTERYARWCERSKIPHQEEFSPTRLSTKGQRKTSDVKEEREKKTKNIIERKNKVGDI